MLVTTQGTGIYARIPVLNLDQRLGFLPAFKALPQSYNCPSIPQARQNLIMG